MNVQKCIFLTVLAAITAAATCRGDLVITGFHETGELTATGVWTDAECWVEWASSADGPWHRTWQPCGRKESQTNTTMTFDVPMFYRMVVSSNPAPVDMVLIDACSFRMGDNYSTSGIALPVHDVSVSAFYVEESEVSKGLWDDVRTWALNHGYDMAVGVAAGANHPVHTVNWYDVVKWCNARSRKEGLTPVYYTSSAKTSVYTNGQVDVSNDWVKWEADGYRLPTEAEWEKAARGGLTACHFPWDSSGGDCTNHIDGSKANYSGSGDPYEGADTTPIGYYNGGQTPVGSRMANGYGLYDMAGNLYEWCWDIYSSSYYESSPGEDPRGPESGGSRTLRGGAWYDDRMEYLRCADRTSSSPQTPDSGTGLRCARSVR